MFNVEFEEVTNQFCAVFDTVVHTGEATLGEKTITANGVYNASSDNLDGYSKVNVNVPTGGGTMQSKSVSYTPTASAQTDTVSPDAGYDGLSSVAVSIAAMPSGTEGTPTATKGAVSNHSVAVTPSVTNVAGYIAGGTKTGTAVTVEASELVSGTKQITANGTNQDVVGYAAVDVAVPNSYSAADEGKVVSSGALVAQTAHADVTPTTSDQTIDTTTNNSIKVKGDADLVAGNIKKDVEIFGVTGSYEGGGGDNTKYLNLIARTGTSFEDEDIVTIGANAFRGWTTLQDLSLPNLVTIGDSAFYGCSAIKNFYFPKATTIAGANAFNGAGTANSVIVLPLLATYPNMNAINSFKGKAVDLGASISTIKGYMFNNCTNMVTLVLRKATVAGLDNINALNNTPFASGKAGGTLYVPQALISSYQSASNWSTILGYATNQIKSIESTHTDPNAPIDLTLYYADGTLIPT